MLGGNVRLLSIPIVEERKKPNGREVEMKAVLCLDFLSQRKDYSVNLGLKTKKTELQVK